MEYGRIAGVEKPVSRLVQGSVMFGTGGEADAFAVLDAVYAAGGRAVDTARHYGDATESALGRWIKERGLRDEIVIIGKGAHHTPERQRVTPADIAVDLEASLRQLGVEAIDLYLLHRDDPSVPVGPIVEALDGHRRAGKILAYGGSNWSVERIAEANAYAAAHGHAPFAASSPNFSLAVWRQPPWANCVTISGPAGEAARAWYAEQGMPVVPWSSLAGGFFSGRFRRDNLPSFTAGGDRVTAEAYGTEDNFRRFDRAQELAERRGLTVPQVALAYLLNQPRPLNVFPLVGARTPAEFAENAGAIGVRLTPDEIAWLDLSSEQRPAA